MTGGAATTTRRRRRRLRRRAAATARARLTVRVTAGARTAGASAIPGGVRPRRQHTTSEVDPGATTALSWGLSTSGLH